MNLSPLFINLKTYISQDVFTPQGYKLMAIYVVVRSGSLKPIPAKSHFWPEVRFNRDRAATIQ